MNICYIISGDLWGGAEEQSFSLIKDISASSGHDIHVITFNHGLLAEKLSLLHIPVYTVDESRNSALMILVKILFFLKKNHSMLCMYMDLRKIFWEELLREF